MKMRQNLYLDHRLVAALDRLARRPGGNKSRIVNDLLADAIARREGAKFEETHKFRLDRISGDIAAAGRESHVHFEAFMLFVRHMLAVLPPLAEGEAAARAEGAERFARFIDALGRELAKTKPRSGSAAPPEATS
jgi:predicted transcriptional regulator